MVGPAFLLMGSPGPCFTRRPTGQLVRSMCKGGVASTRFAAEPVTGSWLNAQVPVSRMASERMLAHFISGPHDHTYVQPRYSCRFLRARAWRESRVRFKAFTYGLKSLRKNYPLQIESSRAVPVRQAQGRLYWTQFGEGSFFADFEVTV